MTKYVISNLQTYELADCIKCLAQICLQGIGFYKVTKCLFIIDRCSFSVVFKQKGILNWGKCVLNVYFKMVYI